MSPPNLRGMSVDNLLALREQIDTLLAERIDAERRQLAERMARLDRYSSKNAPTSTQKPLPAKYCNPDNPQETWAGRGRFPRWMEPALKSGKKKEDFLIEKVLQSKDRSR
jgi:DNA-binding protein H-NS